MTGEVPLEHKGCIRAAVKSGDLIREVMIWYLSDHKLLMKGCNEVDKCALNKSNGVLQTDITFRNQ